MVESAGASETFLGLDLGTSSVRALLIDADQRAVAEASAGLSISRPHPLWSEQNPEDWIEGVGAAVAAVRRHAPDAFAGLAGIGLSGQMHGATFLDGQNRVLRPAILWNDGRSFAQCIELERRVPDFRHRAGNLAMPGFTAPKALWVAEHEPDVFKATQRILLPKDFARLRLTGEAVSDMSDASGTLWLDIARRRWDDDLLAATGLSVAQMPRLVEGSEVSAFLSPEYAAAWGLGGRRIPIAGGAGDNAASAVGVGAVRAGEGFVSLGTSGVVFSVTDKYVSLPERTLHAFCHALPGRWHGMSVMLSAASALSWIAGVIGRGEEIGACVDAAEVFARSTSDVVAAPIFLPYLPGAAALVYAVLEGVAFAFADGVDVLAEAGARPVRPLLVGGGARSGFWAQTISDVTGLTIELAPGAGAGAALGAARLGMLAAGAGDEKSICARPPVQREFLPDAARAALHAPRLRRYRALYGAEKAAR